MNVDRRAFLATLGVGAVEIMSPEDKAEALEHHMMHELDEAIAGTGGEADALQDQEPKQPRGYLNVENRLWQFLPRCKPGLEILFDGMKYEWFRVSEHESAKL